MCLKHHYNFNVLATVRSTNLTHPVPVPSTSVTVTLPVLYQNGTIHFRYHPTSAIIPFRPFFLFRRVTFWQHWRIGIKNAMTNTQRDVVSFRSWRYDWFRSLQMVSIAIDATNRFVFLSTADRENDNELSNCNHTYNYIWC